MRALTWILAAMLIGLLLLCLSGCTTTAPKVPETVTVIVERYKPLPPWTTETLPNPVPKDGTVQSRLARDNARGEIIDYANCRSMLLIKLDKGEAVDRNDCKGGQ